VAQVVQPTAQPEAAKHRRRSRRGSSSDQWHRGRLCDNNRIATQGKQLASTVEVAATCTNARWGGRSGYDGLVGSSAGTSASECRAAGASAGW
jgi:hypothetical protein